MNYVDVNFIQKELKERIVSDSESHYAEVVVNQMKTPVVKPQTLSNSTDETLYRLISDHKVEKPKLSAKVGDIFLSKGQEKNGQLMGILLQVSPKNCYHPNITLPVDKLEAYMPVRPRHPLTSNTSLSTSGVFQPPKSDALYVDMRDCKLPGEDMRTFVGFFTDFSDRPPPPMPVLPAPSRDKIKLLPKQKLSKLKAEFKHFDNEVPVFAICDRKRSNKEKEVLTFKQKQLGVLVFSSAGGWWLIRMVDGTTTTLGWVPRDFWRIMPESMDDDYSDCNYSPWLPSDSENTEMEKKLMANGNDKDFLFVHDKEEQSYVLLMKSNNEVHRYKVNILPDKKLVFSGKYFQTLDNLVLYFKRVTFNVNGVECTLGLPFKNE